MFANNTGVSAALLTLKTKSAPVLGLLRSRAVPVLMTAFVIAVFLMPQLITHASTTITIDTDVLFGSVNDWIATFLPIFAIGLGIAIALAIIAIVGDSILQGLRRGVR